ncbi:hypothetical protein BBK82_31305 [Lentzea guizhouensis]|uniref:OmpR/PhoB-type domain-containing protein n=2 Tax=Lentzea guizhouensis TaxID=1586287 RepID=A0A1B2HZM4_9PSEU|nr:hypothetical protein BBK82_31305 [Lentzea guizhouensis]
MLVGDRVIEVGHARKRAVLAALLVDVNKTVSTDQLVTRVWGDRGNRSTRNSLFTYVSRLRPVLAEGGVAIERRSGGYVLVADPLTIDVHLFAHLVGTGALGEALALWRGEALRGMDSPWAVEVRARLDADRLTAQLDHNDQLLDAGRHHELVAELRAMTVAQPLDERVARQFMLALYRNGRQAEALEHFQRLRRTLADELGVDPGAAVRKLHQRMLEADPALVPGTRDVPRQLPAEPRLFTGRERELGQLADGLGTVVVSGIGGGGGIGKTWLALRWAYEHLDRFPDGQLYVDLRGFDPVDHPVTPSTALSGFLSALGVAAADLPSSVDAQAALYRSLLATRRMMIVLDNAADTAQVEPLLAGSPLCAMVVTSRRRLTKLVVAHGAHVIDLDTLSDAEAHDLIARRLPADRLAAEPDAVAEVLRWCGGLPLALSIVASRAAMSPRLPLAVLAAELRDEADRLDALDDTEAGLRSVLATSCRALPEDALELFRLLGLAPSTEISTQAVGALADMPIDALPLDVLVDAHLLTEVHAGRYRMHDLVRLYAREEASGLPNADQAALRLVDHYLFRAYRAERLLYPQRPDISLPESDVVAEDLVDAGAAMEWLKQEHHSLLATIRMAEERGWHDRTWKLTWTLTTYHFRRGLTHDALETTQTGLRATQELAEPQAEALAHRRVADAHARLGAHELARRHLEHSIDISHRIGDVAGQAQCRYVLGVLSEQQGDFAQGLTHARAALQLYMKLDRTMWLAQGHAAVGWFSARTGDYEQARTHSSAAVELYRSIEHVDGEAASVDSLGLVAYETGDFHEALAHYERARELYQRISGVYVGADILSRLGRTHAALGDRAAARRVWQEALEMYETQSREGKAEEIRALLADLG